MQKPCLVLGIAGLVLACESGPVTASPQSSPAAAAPGAAKAGPDHPSAAPAAGVPAEPGAEAQKTTKSYGGPFEPVPEVKLSTIVANPSAYADKTVIVEGKVQRACTRKGCWMEIGEGPDACRVTFKDYAFFVPTNSAGAHARLQGRVETSQVEPAAVEHLESEGARFQSKGKDGTATEVRLVASAVQLTR
jgi:Domain of unknown function (DUF4920)